MKKYLALLMITLCLCCSFCNAATRNVTVLLNRDLKLSYDSKLQELKNTKGEKVYPISYDGTTYVPLRSISALFGQKIKWDAQTNSVYIGEGELDTNSVKAVNKYVTGSNEDITVLLNEDIKIYYADEVQKFEDANGKRVYPLSYNGTTYLPVRAVSNLFDTDIDWDGNVNTVYIGENYNRQNRDVTVLLNRELKITYDGNIQEFQDAKEEKIYPISYEGTTYVPLRAISSLFNQKIKWDEKTNSVHIGEGEFDKNSTKTTNKFTKGKNENVVALLNYNLKIYYDDEVQNFEDTNGKRVYPLSYNGTTYLPVRALSNLFETSIDWDSKDNAVQIGKKGESTSDGKSGSSSSSTKENETKDKILVTDIKINRVATTINIGKSEQLKVAITPNDATNKKVTWSSSNTKIATVDENGKVTAKAIGSASITAKANDGSNKKANCVVTVKEQVTNITAIKLSKTNEKLQVGQTSKLIITIEPSNAVNKEVTWSSSNTNVVTVDKNGMITAKSVGKASVSVEANNGEVQAICNVTVEEKATTSSTVLVTGININATNVELDVGKERQLSAIIIPDNATNKGVAWSSSNANVVTVDDNGKIIAKAVGTATVSAKAKDGSEKQVTCTVTVKEGVVAVTGISISEGATNIQVGQTKQISATANPSNATNKGITWSSSDAGIATVDGNGVVSAVKPGKVNIVARTNDGGHEAICVVTVTPILTDKIHFINLGENGTNNIGDAILLESQGTYAMIDTGRAANGNTVLNYLKSLGISRLEFIVFTHSHGDHTGGYPAIVNSGIAVRRNNNKEL